MKHKIILFLVLLMPITLKVHKVYISNQIYEYDTKLMYEYYISCDIPYLDFDRSIKAIQERNDIDTILCLVSRESSFKSTACGANGDYGWCQFTQEATLYHNLNYDSLIYPKYAVKAIIVRLNDLRRLGYFGKKLIIGYGAYSRDTSNMNHPALLKFDSKMIELKQFKIKKICPKNKN